MIGGRFVSVKFALVARDCICGTSQLMKLSDSNVIRTHNQLFHKRTLSHLASLAKWLSVRLRTKRLWVRITLLSLRLRIWRLLRAMSSLRFLGQTIECRFPLKLVRDMIITSSYEIKLSDHLLLF